MKFNKEKCKVLPLGRRNQNPKHKLGQAVTLPKTAMLWQDISLFRQGTERKAGLHYYSAPLLWGLHPFRDLACRKGGTNWRDSGDDEQEWGEGRKDSMPNMVNSDIHISHPKSSQVQSPTDAMTLLSRINVPLPTLVCPLPHCLLSTALQPWALSLGALGFQVV